MPPSTVGSTRNGPEVTSHPLAVTIVAMLSASGVVMTTTADSPGRLLAGERSQARRPAATRVTAIRRTATSNDVWT